MSTKTLNQVSIKFEDLVSEYKERLYWHIRRMVVSHEDADDVLQNTFIKVYKNLDTFNGDSQVYTWLYRIATNESLTFINKRKRTTHLSSEDFQESLITNLTSDPYFNGDEAQLKLQQAIDTLPAKQKQVFIMKYYDELQYNEISEILGTSEGALKASYHHAVKKITDYVTGI
ncbi:RNA polymerase sigma factor [Leeuwenhoekiella sp. W20_SRS_FM14]|uniref:RNA polymerase sigma factor n=1 Tax=Leeuwenhoekiella sp. W20_SRS_FM14 TaxID=3240270 RepID=UPI003F961067